MALGTFVPIELAGEKAKCVDGGRAFIDVSSSTGFRTNAAEEHVGFRR